MDVYEQLSSSSSSSSSSYGLPVYIQLHMTWKKEEEIDTGQQLRRRKRRSKEQGDVGDSTGRAYMLFRPTYMALLLFFISPFFVVVEKRRAQKPVFLYFFIFIFFLTYPLCVFWLAGDHISVGQSFNHFRLFGRFSSSAEEEEITHKETKRRI